MARGCLLALLPLAGAFELGIGQDVENIELYVASVNEAPAPRYVMAYTSMAHLRGLWEPTDYGSGVEFASKSLADVEGASLQLGLYLDDLEAIVDGRCDENLTSLREYLDEQRPESLVRIGYEFDNPSNAYDPVTYKAAFRRVAAALRKGGNNGTTTKTVWHSWSFDVWDQRGGGTTSIADWWPGLDYVDWCGVSIFQQAYPDSPLGDLSHAEEMADFCRARNLPLMIAESTPFGLGVTEDPDTIWDRWFRNVRRFVRQNDVQLWCYVNCYWDLQPMWRGEGWGDTRIQDYPALKAKWIAMLRQNEKHIIPFKLDHIFRSWKKALLKRILALLLVPLGVAAAIVVVVLASVKSSSRLC